MRYGYLGTMRAAPGRRDEVVAILLSGQDGLRAAGCDLYVVGTSDTDPDLVWVQEVWASKEHHQASLQLPETKAAIAKAMPMLTGEFTSQELDIVGGLGLRE
ncbi:putative quinol monooxygenase [Actinophytocola gossypii]|uniref:Antibiotic biosynthesis monooxygenase n=1 Tax=Actinophytocola gossypii TaxID=2812003 RepID=A0ABT2J6B5_9PSEU|nr:putative quinol monooxygenase [Actinophytocola gossypii]MCT2583407.1 antibiotic biosynthesis monooxygenase [Actinophytocola gossypii]